MNKYIVTFEWGEYSFYETFSGENKNDPKMRNSIIDWIGSIGDDDAFYSFISKTKEETIENPPIDNFKCCKVSEEINLEDIIGEAWDTFNKQNDERQKQRKAQEQENELRQLERLKNKYEKE